MIDLTPATSQIPNGQLDTISGYAIQNADHQAELEVFFPVTGGVGAPCLSSEHSDDE